MSKDSRLILSVGATSPRADHVITFHDADSGVVGEMALENGEVKFRGNATESAEIFINCLSESLTLCFERILEEQPELPLEDEDFKYSVQRDDDW